MRHKAKDMALEGLRLPADDWRHTDPVTAAKLAASLQRHGQLRPVVVRSLDGGAKEVLEGRQMLLAMRALGWEKGSVLDVGSLPAQEAGILRLSMQLQFETRYAALAHSVAALLASGASVAQLASAGPYAADRIAHFDTLTRFDWSRFAPARDGQSAMSWDEDESVAEAIVVEAAVAQVAEPEAEPPTPPPAVQVDMLAEADQAGQPGDGQMGLF